jgi:hypothetical protein
MKEEPDPAVSSLIETMAARIEINELGDPARQKEIIDAVDALDGGDGDGEMGEMEKWGQI